MTNEVAKSPQGRAFRDLTTRMAGELLTDWVGEERAGEAIGRIGAAMSSAAATAKKPQDFYSCTPASVANCVAVSALTGIMPSTGAASLAYLIPRSPRKNEPKQLNFSFSHRGLNALASRSGQIMLPIPISTNDRITVTNAGEVEVESVDFDNPPTDYDELRGVVVVVKRIETGITIARGWMPKKLIDRRRDESDAYQYAEKNDWAKDSDPWHKWPVEMAMKTAMHYAVSRGWCVIDDSSAVRALAAEAVDAVSVRAHPTTVTVSQPATLDELSDQLNAPRIESNVESDEGPANEAGDDGPAFIPEHLVEVRAAFETLTTIGACDETVKEFESRAQTPEEFEMLKDWADERKTQIREKNRK